MFAVLIDSHLCLRVQSHGHINELLVKEGNPSLHAPGSQGLVGSQTVIEMELGKLSYSLLMEFLCIGCLMEVEISAEELIGALTGEHHLDTHALDDAGQEEHRR